MKKNVEVNSTVRAKIKDALDSAYQRAQDEFAGSASPVHILSNTLRASLAELSEKSGKAGAAFTNIVTCLAIKAAIPAVDMRYHQTQIQGDTDRPAGFNFRGVSEITVAPWLTSRSFEGAKSGWQTRTLERPKPYTLSYDENISDVKSAFLTVFHEIEELGESPTEALAYLMFLQVISRDSKKIVLSVPKTNDIQLIVKVFKDHFFHTYRGSKGASRLPVLALYAVYLVLVDQLDRYKGMQLKPLEQHSAADSQTGAVGDIEVVDSKSGEVFEALEVKHDIALNERIIQDAAEKIMSRNVDRYYILTTHPSCEPDEDLAKKISRVKDLYHCQLIANGVIPSLRYYLRLLTDPSAVFPKYVNLLQSDDAVKHEHREVWNKLATEG